MEEAISKTKKTIEERLRKFRGDKPMPQLTDKVLILVDDGFRLRLHHAGCWGKVS